MKRVAISLAARLMTGLLGIRGKQRLSILIYHRVLPEPDSMCPYEPTVTVFDWQMRLLRRYFNPLPLMEGIEKLQAGELPERAVSITFDDGYADNALQALPVLEKHGIPATFFVSTGFLDGGRMWNDSVIETVRNFRGEQLDLRDLGLGCYNATAVAERLAAVEKIIGKIKHLDPDVRITLVREIEKKVSTLPDDLMMRSDQVRLLAHKGFTIGAHTVNHPILSSVPDDLARREILESKTHLEELVQREVELFAYPNGKPGVDYGPTHPELVRELKFKAAVSTHWGVGTRSSDRFQLPRFTPWDREELKFALRLLANYRRVDPLVDRGHGLFRY